MKQEEAVRAQELCEGRGGRPELPVPNKPYSLCRRKTTLEEEEQLPVEGLLH